jgi:hypothetical protein
VRLAIHLSLVALGMTFFSARADDAFTRISMDAHWAYIVPENYAAAHKAELVESIPGPVVIDDFWTPPEQDVRVADRVLLDLLHDAVKDPTILFPDLTPNPDPTAPPPRDSLEYEQNELARVSENYSRYLRQYVGIIVDGQKLIFCNYSEGTEADPSTDYIFVQKTFIPGESRFLQCRFEPWQKVCSNVSLIGSWQVKEK